MSGKNAHRLKLAWARNEHPVYHLETRRRTQNRSLMALRWGCVPAIFAITGLAILVTMALVLLSGGFWDAEEALQMILGFTLAVLLFIQIGAGAIANILVIAQAAPAISGEVELQSWRLLRTTTLPLREIILAKMAAVLAHMRAPFVGLLILRAISTLTALFIVAYAVRSEFYYRDPQYRGEFWTDGLWVPYTIAGLVFLAYYVLQPVIQLVLNSMLGMLASAYARSRSRAVATGLTGRLAGWVTSIMLNIGAIYALGFLLLANWASPNYAPLKMFQGRPVPSSVQIAWVTGLTVAVYILVVLAGQVGFVMGALRLTQRRARHLGT